jgi:ElaB/YqjD/DUF883 family membrane-anchored ribosome-binding protein
MDTTTATNGARNAATQAADTAAGLADNARSALDSSMKRAQRAAQSAADWASQASNVVGDASLRGYRTAEDAIRLQPVLAVAGALVAGVLIGALLFSRED